MTTMESVTKETSIRIPVSVHKGWQRKSSWEATVRTAGGKELPWWSATGKTQAEATANLSALVSAGMARAEEKPILVLGGAGDYVGCIHLITAHVHGYTVDVVRDGRQTASWSGGDSMKEVLDGVLSHVGGDPTVVRL